jgi:hypothetical protein
MRTPAFPAMHYDLADNEHGLTMRDYFAAKALQGLLANPKLQDEILKQGGCLGGWIETSAYGFADAMMEAREK